MVYDVPPLNETVCAPAATVLEEQSVLVNEVDGVLSMPPKTINVPALNVIAPSVSMAAAGEPLLPADPGPLTMTTPPVWVKAPLLSIPSVSPLVETATSK